MIKNRRELLAMAAEWTNMAKNDLRNQIIGFMESVGTNITELAHALGISEAELEQILNGNGEITLSTFAKILIATDNVLEIKPMAATQFGGFDGIPTPPMGGVDPRMIPPQRPKRPMPTRGKMPMGGMMPPPGVMPPMFGEEAPTRFGGMPGMGGKIGRPMPRPQRVEVPQPNRREVINTVLENGWEDEVDLMNSTTDELMDFVNSKMAAISQPQIEEEIPTATPSRLDEALAKIGAALESNPELMRQLERYL
jgi:transcriptional regulator with XRE-family HTH domain